jgi:crotonobetainyl-CoA:carnitine CoA-transferase CaiB-like acyl-CoA transferase
VVIAGNSDGIFKRLMHAIGRPDLAADPALARNDGRARQERMLDAAIEEWTSQRGVDDVLAALGAADVPSGRIYTAEDIYGDPHYRARGMIEPATMPDAQPIDLPGVVPKLSATPGATRWVGPALGEHVAEVLAEIGITAAQLDQLKAEGII